MKITHGEIERMHGGIERTDGGIERTDGGIERVPRGIERTDGGIERVPRGIERTGKEGRGSDGGGTLFLVATPIGNLGDLSPRALETLRTAPVVAAEDTRRTWQLLSHFGVPRPPRMVSYREGAEERAGAQILECLRAGQDVALCTDAGYPGISDPGFRLVRDAVAEGLPVTALPGPSAADVALVLSGLPTSSWTFLGFPPRKPGALRRFFENEARSAHTLVLYESPFRVGKTLAAAAEVLGARPAAVCLELTKMHERIERGALPDLAARFSSGPARGEIAIVIGGLPRAARRDADDPSDFPDGG